VTKAKSISNRERWSEVRKKEYWLSGHYGESHLSTEENKHESAMDVLCGTFGKSQVVSQICYTVHAEVC
jgi:hypothetical protein